MLFDLRGRGRQNVVKFVYLFLALLMGGGLVLFNIGGGASGGGLFDAITGSSSSGTTGADRYKKDIAAAKKKIAANKSDELAYTDLIRSQISLAGTNATADASTGTPVYSAKGKDQLRDAVASWNAYEALEPKNKEEQGRIASRVVQAYAGLEDIDGLVGAQEIVALNRNAVGPYSSLAQYAYLAGQTRKGDLAAKKALSLEDPDQRKQLKGDLDSAKQQAAQQTAAAAASAVPSVTVAPAPSAAATAKPKPKKK